MNQVISDIHFLGSLNVIARNKKSVWSHDKVTTRSRIMVHSQCQMMAQGQCLRNGKKIMGKYCKQRTGGIERGSGRRRNTGAFW